MGGQGIGLADAERAFRDWRRRRDEGGGRQAIPEALWEQAVRAAGVHGLTETAKRLRLNHTKLKLRCAGRPQATRFVEIAARELPPLVGESIVEVEDAAGSRVRLVRRGVSVAAATAAAKELWSAAR